VRYSVSFGKKLRALREGRDLGLRELSRESGLALSHIQYLEQDTRTPGDETLGKLAKALRVPVAELKREQITGQVSLLLKEAGELTKEQEQEVLDAIQRASGG
jgi:transcriptional regulator with XRE-family HTH domain